MIDFVDLILDTAERNKNLVTYGDVIDAITESGVLESTAELIIETLPIGDYPDLYEGAIKIMNSDYLGTTKEHMVRTMISKVGWKHAAI